MISVEQVNASSFLIGPFKQQIRYQDFDLYGDIKELEEKGLFKLPKPTNPKVIEARRTLDNMGIKLEEDPSLESVNLTLEYKMELMCDESGIYEYGANFIRLSGILSIEMMDINTTDPDDRESYDVELDLDLQEAQFSQRSPWVLSWRGKVQDGIVPQIEIKKDMTIDIEYN
jgi:hypothetical protein